MTLTLLCGLGSALAQAGLNGIPDAAECAALVAPVSRPLPPALVKAVQATTVAYNLQNERLFRPLTKRPPTAEELGEIERLSQETSAYLGRLLAAYGWPADPALRGSFVGLLGDGRLQYCAGQAALAAATSPDGRTVAASLIDRGLNRLDLRQRYGTLYTFRGGRAVPLPIEDETNVEARRAELELPPLAKTLAQAQANLPARTPPPGLKRPVTVNLVCQPFTTKAVLNMPLTGAQLDRLDDEAGHLVEQDQASRLGQSGARDLRVVDAESTAWLQTTLRQFGWPSTNRADAELAFNAWLLAQHADAKTALQACILDLIVQQKSTQSEDRNFAYLTDRVRLAQNLPQLYGTQVQYDSVWRKASPRMLEDPAHVNELRVSLSV
ncbi:DUF6624 domain-containing protein [Deinococcus frigens]|uniref:DUF6624 domain-containing protein n=1 Tax=Deinococcus frigens TaxID=249403 RepID=UPI00138DD229|nr:DUF6624 domain-containing protein [Deinococcus frigens]